MKGRHDTRRRFEQWVKNPTCEANTVSAVAGVSMADVAVAEGLEPSMGQSPFAIARGTTFESRLFADNAERLRTALEEANVLSSGSAGFADFRLRLNGGPMPDQDEAHRRTVALLHQAASASTKADLAKLPSIVASATLRIPGMPVMLPDGVLAIDALLLIPGEAAVELVICEIKTYPDRAGYTDSAELGTSRAQAGVYLHALELVLNELGLDDSLTARQDGVLVLSRAGSNFPSIRAGEDLAFQARRAARGFERLRAAAKTLVPFDPEDADSALSAVRGATTSYSQTCLSFCDRASGCRSSAETCGNPAVLGDDVARFLGPTTLPRAIELLEGAAPAGDSEADFLQRVAAARGESA